MSILKNKFLKIVFGLILITSFSSCDEGGDPDPGKTNTGQFAGDWFITGSEGGVDQFEHELHSTYNTSANDNTMWIDDHGNGWAIKCKINMNQDGTFSVTNSENIGDAGTVTVTNGKIISGGAISRGGHTVDKITFDAEFSYDPGVIIHFDGHKRTGFLEDEY